MIFLLLDNWLNKGLLPDDKNSILLIISARLEDFWESSTSNLDLTLKTITGIKVYDIFFRMSEKIVFHNSSEYIYLYHVWKP